MNMMILNKMKYKWIMELNLINQMIKMLLKMLKFVLKWKKL